MVIGQISDTLRRGFLLRPTDEGSATNSDSLLLLLLLFCIGRLWLMPLWSSFWVDEMVTAFIVRLGSDHPSLAVAPQVTQSIYYFLPRATTALLGFSEAAYRLPSIVVQGIALMFIAFLAGRLIDRRSVWFACFACLALRGFDYEAVDARPYALGTCLASAALFFLVRWLDREERRSACLFLLCAGLLWWVHLIFWPLYIVFALYTFVRLWRHETRVGWSSVVLTFALLCLADTPVLIEAFRLLQNARVHVIVPVPSYLTLVRSIQLEMIAYCAVGAWLFGGRLARKAPVVIPGDSVLSPGDSREHDEISMRNTSVSISSLTLILGWWLCTPICLFAYSHATGESVFVPRYLSIALPGAALAATAAAGLLVPPARWKRITLILGALALIVLGQWHRLWPRHDNSDWRSAAHGLKELGLLSETPVICPSPFVEARAPAWRPEYPLPGFLYAHLLMYPIPGKPVLFPYDNSPEAQQFAGRLTRETLLPSGRFIIYGGERIVRIWRDWFSARPELAGWRREDLPPFGNIDVVIFENR